MLSPPSTPGLTSIFHRGSSSKDESSKLGNVKGHTRNKSSGSGSSFDHRLQSAFSPVDDDRKSMRPAILDKALDAIRERERTKRRKDLKSQIKFVGQVDPEKVHESSSGKQRRETFGEGWI